MRRFMLLAATALALVPALATAAETISYIYDARGRLIRVDHTGTVNNGVATAYSYERADNRTNAKASLSGLPPSFSIGNDSAAEGETLIFTVIKTGATSGSFSVNYATADSTALAGSDYTAGSGTLTFAASETSKTISVLTTDDTAAENSETLVVNLSAASGGAAITDSQGAGTIADNDTATTGPSFSVSNDTGTEGETLVFTVTKTGTTSSSFSVNYGTANGSAAAGSDYTAKSGTLTFAASVSTKSSPLPATA